MASLFCLRFMNFCLGAASTAYTTLGDGLKALSYWITGYNSQWFFMTNRSIPIPARNYTQFTNGVPDNISWAFNAESHILSSLTYSSIRNRLRCLSLDIHDGNNVHSLDSFLPTLALYIHDDLPTPMVLAACWSILSGVWPSPTGRPHLAVAAQASLQSASEIARRGQSVLALARR